MPERIQGQTVDDAGRCIHHHTMLDILALRIPCCPGFWACRTCHDTAHPEHPLQVWPRGRRDVHALLCGACQEAFSIDAYLADPDVCPHCAAPFNPGCRQHHGLYFA